MIQNNSILPQYNYYPDVISYANFNPTIRIDGAPIDLMFYETKETLLDVEVYRDFIKSAVSMFRATEYYKAYKSYLMSMGLNRCQVMGNITDEDAPIELHHNILNLFDIALMICEHVVNTVGIICTYDLVQLLILEHQANRIPIVFLSETAHQMYTVDPQGYLPPDMVMGRWWELLEKYKYGITLEIAYKVMNYIKKYRNQLPVSIDVIQQEEILNFAIYNECGMPASQCGFLPYEGEFEDGYYYE